MYIGKIILKLRALKEQYLSKYYSHICNSDGAYISGNCILINPQNITVGKNTYINGGQIHAGKNSKIIIGKNCMISHNIHIRTTEHNYLDTTLPMNKQGMHEDTIVIGDDVWIGYGAQILSGVKIGSGAVIAAGAVVTKNCESNFVYGGIPAKKLKKRGLE